MNTAKAAVYEGPERITIQEFPLPEMGTEDMLVEVVVAGIDGSDIHMFRGEIEAINEITPVIFGDEIIGAVAEVGEEAARRRGVQKGDFVVVESKWPCHDCEFCNRGDYYLCQKGWKGNGYGWISCRQAPHLWGSYATHVFVPKQALVYKVPTGLDLNAALISASVLANAYRWTELGEINLGDAVVIIGPGPQGLCCTLLSHLRAAAPIIVIGLERDAERLAMAEQLGANSTIVISSKMSEPDVLDAVARVLGDTKACVVIETAGSQSAMDLAVHLVKPLGKIVSPSITKPSRLMVDFNELLFKEASIIRPLAHPYTVSKALRLGQSLAGGPFDLSKMVTHSFPLEQAERALRTAAYEYEERPLKVALRLSH